MMKRSLLVSLCVALFLSSSFSASAGPIKAGVTIGRQFRNSYSVVPLLIMPIFVLLSPLNPLVIDGTSAVFDREEVCAQRKELATRMFGVGLFLALVSLAQEQIPFFGVLPVGIALLQDDSADGSELVDFLEESFLLFRNFFPRSWEPQIGLQRFFPTGLKISEVGPEAGLVKDKKPFQLY